MELAHTSKHVGYIRWSKQKFQIYNIGDRVQARLKAGKIVFEKTESGSSTVGPFGVDKLRITLPRAILSRVPIMGVTPVRFDFRAGTLFVSIPQSGRIPIRKVRTKKLALGSDANRIREAVSLINSEKKRVGADLELIINADGLLQIVQRYGP